MGDQRDVRSMTDAELLRLEEETYESWVLYSARSASGATFGAFGAIASLGMSLIFTVPAVSRNMYWADHYSAESTRYTEEVKRRGLTSFRISYGMLALGTTATVVIGGVCASIPYADGALVGLETAAGSVVNTVEEAAAVAATAKLQATCDAAHGAVDGVANSAHEMVPGADVQVVAVHGQIDAAEAQALQALAETANAVTAMDIIKFCVQQAFGLVLIGCDSRVAALRTRNAKDEMAKYEKLNNQANLDRKMARQIVDDVLSPPASMSTQFRDLTDQEVLQKETTLVVAASSRLASTGWLRGEIGIQRTTCRLALFVQARVCAELAWQLRSCEYELRRRHVGSEYKTNVVDAATNGLLAVAERLALFASEDHTKIPARAS